MIRPPNLIELSEWLLVQLEFPSNTLCVTDVDECRSPSVCPGGTCVNTQGSFQCQRCDSGFRPAGGRCLGKTPRRPRMESSTAAVWAFRISFYDCVIIIFP